MPETIKSPIGAEALERAIDLVGLTELAKAVGGKYQLIQGWRVTTRRYATPAEYVLAVEKAVGRRVTRYELRPDIYIQPARRKVAKAA